MVRGASVSVNPSLRLDASTPFLEGVPNSIVSRPWYRLLTSITAILADQNTSSITDTQIVEIFDAPSPAVLASLATILATVGSLNDLLTQLAMLPDQTAALGMLRQAVSDALVQGVMQSDQTAALEQMRALVADSQAQLAMQIEFNPGPLLQRISDNEVMEAFS